MRRRRGDDGGSDGGSRGGYKDICGTVIIGILNLLPIPVLDGGHLVFHAYEAITRRQPAEWALRILMTFGLTVVLSIMIFGLSRDLLCQ